MPSKSSLDRPDDNRKRLRDSAVRAAEWLCTRSWAGVWGGARTNASVVWALCECGLAQSDTAFIEYSLEQLLGSDECKISEHKINFNYEVWDSSVGLIALHKGGSARFSSQVDGVADWLLSEVPEDNFRLEPWETLWGVHALLLSAKQTRTISPVITSCVKWMLDKRTADGILIAPHYMGFLLVILSEALHRLRLTGAIRQSFQVIIDTCINYLRSEYAKEKKKGRLWSDQPWVIGHILAGIASCDKSRDIFFKDARFNRHLADWLEDSWDQSDGWVDVLDTANLLVGLGNYYVEFESAMRGSNEARRLEVLQELSSLVSYHFDPDKVSPKMTIQPIWRSRVKKNDKACFIIMPFKRNWSQELLKNLRSIMEECGFTAIRADDYHGRVIIEDVWKGINEARIIVADCSPPLSANVFYELGIAHTLGKDVIIISQEEDPDKAPFDIRHLRHVFYTSNESGYAKLREEIPKNVRAILSGM